MYHLFYNHEHVGDVLFIVLQPNAYPDDNKVCGDVNALYKEGQLIGINIFNFGKTAKIKASGMFIAPNDVLLDVINDKLVNAGLEKLPYCRDSGFKVAEVTLLEEHPLDERLRIVTLKVGENTLSTVSRYQNIEVGSKVVIVTDGAMKFDGTTFEKKVSRNIPIDCEICSPSDLRLSDEFKAAYLEEKKASGDDFFID